MAKANASDQIMAPDKMKPILAFSKREAVQAAIALTTDGEAILLLDKKAKPRGVMGMLKSQAAKAKLALNGSSVRFGRAEVDPEYDPGTVRLFVNKDTPGAMRVKLTELIKRVPYQKVEINVDPSLEEEAANEADGHEAAAAGVAADAGPATAPADATAPAGAAGSAGAAASADAAAPTASASPTTTATAAAAEPIAAAPAAASPATATPAASDAAGVLADLTRRIPDAAGADAARLATLKKIAALAGVKLQAGDAAGAANAIAALRQAVEAAPPADKAAADPADGAAVRLAKGLLLWNGARSYVKQELSKLEAAIIAQSENEADAADIRQNVGKVSDAVLDALDDRLSDKLNELRGETDAAKKRAISEDAKRIVASYQAFIAEDELMNDLDDNGVLPLDIRPRLTTVLQAVLQVM